MQPHVGADAQKGLSHSADISAARIHDVVLGDTLLHGEESIAFGDRGYANANWSLDAPREKHGVLWATPFKRKKGQRLTDEQRRINPMVSSIRAPVEHAFRIIERQFGYARTRYRGLYKNGQQRFTPGLRRGGLCSPSPLCSWRAAMGEYPLHNCARAHRNAAKREQTDPRNSIPPPQKRVRIVHPSNIN